jgi:hypothetical protein
MKKVVRAFNHDPLGPSLYVRQAYTSSVFSHRDIEGEGTPPSLSMIFCFNECTVSCREPLTMRRINHYEHVTYWGYC